jgi:hypothetical protein
MVTLPHVSSPQLVLPPPLLAVVERSQEESRSSSSQRRGMVCKEERRRSFASTHARAAIEWTVDWPLEEKGDAF